MKYTEVLNEKLKIDSDIEKINRNFRTYIEQVFSPVFLKKIDRVFKTPLIIENFKQNSNIMALTVGKQISVNIKMFEELSAERGMVYIIHELFHVLQNLPQFKEVKKVNELLKERTLKVIPKQKINEFLTGKEQDIHSNFKDEFLSYCSNFAFDWSLYPNLEIEYYKILKSSGLFNMNSSWWKVRFKKIIE